MAALVLVFGISRLFHIDRGVSDICRFFVLRVEEELSKCHFYLLDDLVMESCCCQCVSSPFSILKVADSMACITHLS
jgi:hypothetical protein